MAGPRKKRKEENKKKGDIQSMIRNMPSKKINPAAVKDDDILGELLSEIGCTSKNIENKLSSSANNVKTSLNSTKTDTQNTTYKISGCENIANKTSVDETTACETFFKDTENNSVMDLMEVAPELIEEDNFFLSPNNTKSESNKKDVENSECKTLSKDIKVNNVVDLTEIVPQQLIKINEVSLPASSKLQSCKTDVQNTSCKTSVKDIKVGNAIDLTKVIPQLIKTKDEEVFRFYYLDVYENPLKNPGTVYFFGKTYIASHDTYASCCVMVHCIPRRIYLLPRKYVCIVFVQVISYFLFLMSQ